MNHKVLRCEIKIFLLAQRKKKFFKLREIWAIAVMPCCRPQQRTLKRFGVHLMRTRHSRDKFTRSLSPGNQLDAGSEQLINVAPSNLLRKKKNRWAEFRKYLQTLVVGFYCNRASNIIFASYASKQLLVSWTLNRSAKDKKKSSVKVVAELMWSRFLCNQLCWHFQANHKVKWQNEKCFGSLFRIPPRSVLDESLEFIVECFLMTDNGGYLAVGMNTLSHTINSHRHWENDEEFKSVSERKEKNNVERPCEAEQALFVQFITKNW